MRDWRGRRYQCEDSPVNDHVSCIEDTGDFSGELVGIIKQIDR